MQYANHEQGLILNTGLQNVVSAGMLNESCRVVVDGCDWWLWNWRSGDWVCLLSPHYLIRDRSTDALWWNSSAYHKPQNLTCSLRSLCFGCRSTWQRTCRTVVQCSVCFFLCISLQNICQDEKQFASDDKIQLWIFRFVWHGTRMNRFNLDLEENHPHWETRSTCPLSELA